jgi:putative resolvase
MDKMISISEAGIILGVTTRTLKRWDTEGKLKVYRTLGNHRRYRLSDVEKFMGLEIKESNINNVFVYARVSTKKQVDNGNLERQKQRLIGYCKDKNYNIVHIYEEVASGLNDSRRELIKMFRKLNDVNAIVVEYEDRLARFGYTYLVEYAKTFGVTIETVDKKDKLEPNEEMVQDLISIVTCFSAKLYGARGGRKVKRTLAELEKERQACSNENNIKSGSC